MRVLIDGTMAKGGGGHTYLVNVIPRLCELAPEDQFRLIVGSERIAESLPSMPNLELDLRPPTGALKRLQFTLFQLPLVAREWDADVFFSPGESAPLWAPCPMVAAFRNPNVFSRETSLHEHWNWGQKVRLGILRALSIVSSRTCQKIMFVSQDSADWIGESIRLPSRRRAVIHHGIDEEAWRPVGRRAMHPRSYILSVSSIYRYKNFHRLIEAYGELATHLAELPDLVIIGDDQDHEYALQMETARLALGEVAEKVHIIGEIPYADIKHWYAGAEMFVFPSFLETFGHPLLEAMVSDLPLIASDIPVFREIAGDAAVYVDPFDPTSIALSMGVLLNRPELREILVKRGRERLREFTWERAATSLRETLVGVLAESSHHAEVLSLEGTTQRHAPAKASGARNVVKGEVKRSA